ncbi:MAG: hypothetical protein K8S20_01655 [Chloroflexi bacterium]|nr:hypothetical protein [Chloroflexota bacterium]
MDLKTVNIPQKPILSEIEELRAQLSEAEETLRAIYSGEVDALIVSDAAGEKIFKLKQAEDALAESVARFCHSYRAAWTEERIRQYFFDSSGTHFDPQVVNAFMKIAG